MAVQCINSILLSASWFGNIEVCDEKKAQLVLGKLLRIYEVLNISYLLIERPVNVTSTPLTFFMHTFVGMFRLRKKKKKKMFPYKMFCYIVIYLFSL